MLRRIASGVRRPFVFPLFLWPALGLVSGYALVIVLDLQGHPRFLAGGALVGLVIGAALSWLQWKGIKGLLLTEMTVSVPEFSEFKFVLNREYQRVAWRLFVETMTRISTQPLQQQHGFLREALNSLHSLFATTRDVLKQMEPTPSKEGDTVEFLAMQMLNSELRPFLAKWHPELKRFEASAEGQDERKWELTSTCRDELESLRRRLVSYARAFGELGGVRQLDKFF